MEKENKELAGLNWWQEEEGEMRKFGVQYVSRRN